MQISIQNRLFFYALLGFTIYLAYLLISPYLGVIAFAFVTVVMFRWVFDYFLRLKWLRGSAGWATTCTILTILATVVIPLWILVSLTIIQTTQVIDDVSNLINERDGLQDVSLDLIILKINEFLAGVPYGTEYQLTKDQVIETAQSLIKTISATVGSFLATSAWRVGNSTAGLITKLIIYVTLLGVLFPRYDEIIERFKHISPLDDDIDQQYINKLTNMTKSMVKGIFIIAFTQGLIAGFFFWVAGVPYVIFWMVLAMLAALFPLGVNAIAIPIGIGLLIFGKYWQAALVILGATLVVSNIDNILRPRLVSEEANLNPALIVLSAFGGLELFGFLGVIYGPVVMIFLMTTMEIYIRHYSLNNWHDMRPVLDEEEHNQITD